MPLLRSPTVFQNVHDQEEHDDPNYKQNYVTRPFHTRFQANAPEQRPRASDSRHETQMQSRGSLHPVCWTTSSLLPQVNCESKYAEKQNRPKEIVNTAVHGRQSRPCSTCIDY